MDFSVISLIVLVVVVAIGFIKKVNLGFLSLGVAFILGTCGGMSAKEIANGFSASMFVTLVGVTFLFGMASANGTLELFSKKVVALVGKNTVLIPVLMFFLSAFISAIGPGHIAAGILMTTFAMYLAFEMDILTLLQLPCSLSWGPTRAVLPPCLSPACWQKAWASLWATPALVCTCS